MMNSEVPYGLNREIERLCDEVERLERDRNNLLCENQQFKDAIKIIMEIESGVLLYTKWVRKVLGKTPWKDEPTRTT